MKKDGVFMGLGCAGMLLWAAFGILQVYAGYLGIRHHWGNGWAVGLMILFLTTQFSLPITIGAFFGAMDVWHWPWYGAFAFALPGLTFLMLGATGGVLRELFKGAPSKATEPVREISMTHYNLGRERPGYWVQNSLPASDEVEEFWHVSDQGQELGAMTATQIRTLLATGRLSADAFVHQPAYSRWLTLEEAGIS